MMARERITRQAEWLGLNRAAAYTLYQPRAQITLRLKTEHANAQESLWHRKKEWATIAPCVASLHIRAYTHFSSLCQVFFSPSVLLYPSALSLFLRHSPPLWPFLLFHWFCYVYLLLHFWNWRHRLTSLLLFNNRSWAFFTIAGLSQSQTEQLRHVNSDQQEDRHVVVKCCIGGEISHPAPEKSEVQYSAERLVFN